MSPTTKARSDDGVFEERSNWRRWLAGSPSAGHGKDSGVHVTPSRSNRGNGYSSIHLGSSDVSDDGAAMTKMMMPPTSPMSSDSPVHSHGGDQGLHHRSNIHRRSAAVPGGAANNVASNVRWPQQQRVPFHSYNPYHSGGQSGGRWMPAMSLVKAVQWCVALLFIGYVVLMGYWAAHHHHSDGALIATSNSRSAYSTGGNGNNKDLDRGGVRSSSNRSGRDNVVHHVQQKKKNFKSQQHPSENSNGGGQKKMKGDGIMDDKYFNKDNGEDDAADTTDDLRQSLIVENQQQRQILSLHEFALKRRQQRGKKRGKRLQQIIDKSHRHQPHELRFALVDDSSATTMKQRRLNRKLRTTPPRLSSSDSPFSSSAQKQQADDSYSPLPIWYNLDHSSFNTILTNQKRWKSESDGGSNNNDGALLNLDTNFHLCGKHAQQAASFHPQNYYPQLPLLSSSSSSSSSSTSATNHHHHRHYQQPLDSQSKVLITGILSPLGFHLALALHRQCNITNFVGVDTQMPNDPLSRLEMLDRLEVLLEELSPSSSLNSNGDADKDGSGSSGKSLWYVPFLGLEGKQPSPNKDHNNNDSSKMRFAKERQRRQRQLVNIRNHPHHFILDENAQQQQKNDAAPFLSFFNPQPYKKFGIPPSPGVNHNGYGTLDIIAECRPTHIVHLAGSQSESLLNVKQMMKIQHDHHYRHLQQHYHPKQQEEEEGEDNDEEEGDGENSISSRPHLYELRMGMTGMEQLLSSVIAQTMVKPSLAASAALNNNNDVQNYDDDVDLNKMMQMPHVVYASSYDARYFSDTANRLNFQQQKQQEQDLHYYQHDNNSSRKSNKEIILGEQHKQRHHHHSSSSPPRGFHGVSHLINEIIAATYDGLHGVSTIGLRFDAVYGPRGFGAPSTSIPILNVNRMRKSIGVSPDVALAEAEVRRLYRKWMKMIKEKNVEDGDVEDVEGHDRRRLDEKKRLSLIEEAGWLHASYHPRDFVFVEDAVGAIIAAMQYRSVLGSPTSFNIGSGEMNTLSTFADKIQQVAFDKKQPRSASKSVIDVERSSAARSASYTSKEYLGWSAKTTLADGVAKLLAWHLDRALPMFPSSTLSEEEVNYSESEDKVILKHMDGKALMSKNNVEYCSDSKDDATTCLIEKHNSYPCASECSTMTCSSSIFDSVIPLVHDATENCYAVLYTAPLGYNLESLKAETEYSDSGTKVEYHEGTVCTIAFVPSESTMVKDVIDDLPASTLSMLDASPSDSYQTKIKKLNGHLASKGWLLIFVDGAIRPLAPEELLVPKLAPARLFHSSVRRAVYIDENFPQVPYPEDILFLSTESYRGKMKSRNIMHRDEKGRMTKYKLPEEPQRYAALLVAQIRDTTGQSITLRQMTRNMMNGDTYEPKVIRFQREFYERAKSLTNSMDLRSSDPAHHHKLETKHFIRSQWVLHNLKLEEGHQVRCEWYREHSRWAGSTTLDSGMDQLSFAYIMAKRDLSGKIVTEQPLPKELSHLEKVIKSATDAHEWHPIFSGDGSIIPLHYYSGMSSKAHAIPLNIADRPEFELDYVAPDTVTADSESLYYVRIMSGEVMLKARKQWSKLVASFDK